MHHLLRHHHARVCALLGLSLLLLGAGPATADRYHVSLAGTRTAGASVPGDWSSANCYPTLAAAAATAAPADSLLLSRETHALTAAVDLSAFLGNADLDADPVNCVLALTGAGQLNVDPQSVIAEVRGLDLQGDGVLRDASALVVANPGGTLTDLSVRGCLFGDFNGGHDFGGAALRARDGDGLHLVIADCSFTGNQTPYRGGAIRIDDGVTATIEDCTFTDNRTVSGLSSSAFGGAIHVLSPDDPTHLTVRRSTFVGNASARIGGALCVYDASLVMEETSVVGSRSAWDGTSAWCAGAGVMVRRNEGAHTEPVALEVRDCLFQDNVGNLDNGPGAGDGGGLMVRGSIDRLVDVTVERSDFLDNYNDQGAGLYVGRYTSGTVSHCRFHRNRTYTSGGATFKGGANPENLGETVVYTFCEFVANEAGLTRSGNVAWSWARGGAFSTRERTRAEFRHCTFVDNVVHGNLEYGDAISLIAEGNAFDSDLERCVLVNCVFWGAGGNDVQVRSDPDGFSQVSHSAWESGEFVCSGVTPVASVTLAASPFTAPDDLLPQPDAPLVDAGLDLGLTPDLAGTGVPQGLAPDIGAYEVPQGVAAPLPSVAALARLTAHPNPFNPATLLTCELARGAQVTVEVVDLAGRRVATLHRGALPGGTHRWRWDGRDRHGRPVAGGPYLARLSADGVVTRLKLMLVK